MINVLLVCSAGMSTSALVAKMEKEAAANNVDAKIWAVGVAEAPTEIPNADVVLLGPQVKFQEKPMRALAGDKPLAVINMVDYGMMNGKKVLDQAIELFNNK